MDKTAVPPTLEQRLNSQASWAKGIDQFQKHTVSDLNRINTDLARLTTALEAVKAAPPFAADELAAHLTELVDQLTAARQAEMNARQLVKDARESYELAVAFALAGANGAVDGKNEEQRKTARQVYLANHAEVKTAQAALDAAQAALEQAQVDLRAIEDEFSATRAAAALMAAQLTYLSGK